MLASKSEGATDKQTRNGAGKSSLVDIIHLLLGGKCDPNSIFKLDVLKQSFFGMKFDLAKDVISVQRKGESANKVIVDPGDTSAWPYQPTKDKNTGELILKNAEWATVLGAAMFGIEPHWPKHAPTFRSVFPYFARRQHDGGFATHETFYPSSSVGQQQVSLSFLLSLDWQVPRDLDESRDKEKAIAKLKKEAGEGLLENFVGKAADLQSQLAIADRRARKLRTEIDSFQVLPEYHDLESEASQIAQKISDLTNENVIDQQRLIALRASLEAEHAPAEYDVARVYEEAGVILSGSILGRLDQVREFHEAVLRNRRSHLESDIEETESRLRKRREEMEQADERRREVLTVLQSHGALDQLNRLQDEYVRLESETEELRRRFRVAKELEKTRSEIKLERAQVHQRLMRDHEEHQAVINEAIVLFEEFSESLSERQGHLTVSPTENGPKFEIEVPSGRSVGIKNMQIFCFDLMLMTLWARKGRGPGFLVHDSHLFDGVDSRQVAKAIEIAAARAIKEGFQYIVTLNSDALPRDEFSKGFDVDSYVLPVQIDDSTETGGIFGFRFG